MPKKPRCKKVRYKDELAAMQAEVNTQLSADKGNTKRREQRKYFCTICKAWHLTSKPPGERQ